MTSCAHECVSHNYVVTVAEEEEREGWTLHQICTMIMYSAKSCGIANSTLDKLLKVFSLVIDTERSTTDVDAVRKFPKTSRALGTFLNLQPPSKQTVVFFCPARRQILKRGYETPSFDLCGFTLRQVHEGRNRSYICDLCDTEWDKQHVEKDGNFFSAQSLNSLLSTTMQTYGKYCSPSEQKDGDGLVHDLYDGERFKMMETDPSDIIFSVHADGAEISKSTKSKMYLMFVHVHNIPLRMRHTVWPLLLVWVGENLPKDREAFLLYLTKELRQLQRGHPSFRPIKWTGRDGTEVTSAAYVHSVFADAPERTALNGHLSHSAGEGCIYCLQVMYN